MKLKAIFVFLVFLLVAIAPSAFAQETSTSSPTAKPTIKRVENLKEKRMEVRENVKTRASAAAEKRKERLSEARLKICKARTKSISVRVGNVLKRGERVGDRNEKITASVEKFYQDKLVPQGLTLSNHDELLTDIEAKKASVSSLLATAQTSGESFSCDSDDPKGQAETFRSDMKVVVDAARAYRQSVRTFAKAVKELAAENRDSIDEEVVE